MPKPGPSPVARFMAGKNSSGQLKFTFAADVRAFCQQVPALADSVLQKILGDVGRRVVEMSPVDTGHFVANWQTSVDTPAEGIIEGTDPTRSGAMAAVAAWSATAKMGYHYYLMNNLPYALPLEYGWSKQAPAGMVRVTINSWPEIVGKAVSK